MLERCCVTLSEAIDIKDCYQIVKTVMTGKVQSLPYRALRTLSVAN